MIDKELKPYDYRNPIRTVIDQIPNSKEGLKLGIISIQEILAMAKRGINVTESQSKELDSIKNPNPEIPEESETKRPSIQTDNVKKSKTTNKADNNQPSDVLEVERLIAGFDLYQLDKSTSTPYYHYDEVTAQRLGVQNHDLVKVNYQNRTKINNKPHIEEIIKTVNDPVNFTILNYCKIERDDNNNLIVKETYNHQTLISTNKIITHYVIPSALVNKLNIKEGQLADIGWYNDEPEKIQIRLIHYDDELTNNVEPASEKQKPQPKLEPTEPAKDEKTETISTLDFDLKGKHVGVVVGDALRNTPIKKLISEHHGRLTMIDAFKHANSSTFYDHQLKNGINYVVMVQNQNKHATSKALNKAAKKYNINMAIANGGGIQQIERAIYRAQNNLPAYESNSNIDYPTK